MNKRATIIFANRQRGKTTRILEEAAKTNGVIVCPTQAMADCGKDHARRTGLLWRIKEFIGFTKYCSGDYRTRKRTNFYFDEAGIELINSVHRTINKINEEFEILTVDNNTVETLTRMLNDELNMQTLDGKTVLLNIETRVIEKEEVKEIDIYESRKLERLRY